MFVKLLVLYHVDQYYGKVVEYGYFQYVVQQQMLAVAQGQRHASISMRQKAHATPSEADIPNAKLMT